MHAATYPGTRRRRPLVWRRPAAPCLLLGVVMVGCEGPGRVVPTLPAPVTEFHPAAPRPAPRPSAQPPPSARGDIRGAKIVIDAGHGGRDPGAGKGTKSRLPEKTITLDIANRLVKSLRAMGATVYPTRTSDTYPSLNDRVALAERVKADLFVSIHADSARNPDASGVGIFIYNQASTASQRAAMSMAAAIEAAGLECRGVQRANFHVLREHNRPAMLIECGFLTNSGDAARLNDPDYRARLAAAIADGIVRFFTR